MLVKKGINEWEIAGTRCRIYGTIYQESENLYLHWFGFDTGYVSCDSRANTGMYDKCLTTEEKELIQKIFDRIILPLVENRVDKVIFDPNDSVSVLPEMNGDVC